MMRTAKTKLNLDDTNQCDLPTNEVLKLHSKIKTAWKVLDAINFSLYHETTNEILVHKPIFDEQKQKLILLEATVEKIYQCGLVVALKPFSSGVKIVVLNSTTKYSDWNEVASQINLLLAHVVQILSIERDLEVGMGQMRKYQDSKSHEQLLKEAKPTIRQRSRYYSSSCLFILFLICIMTFAALVVAKKNIQLLSSSESS